MRFSLPIFHNSAANYYSGFKLLCFVSIESIYLYDCINGFMPAVTCIQFHLPTDTALKRPKTPISDQLFLDHKYRLTTNSAHWGENLMIVMTILKILVYTDLRLQNNPTVQHKYFSLSLPYPWIDNLLWKSALHFKPTMEKRGPCYARKKSVPHSNLGHLLWHTTIIRRLVTKKIANWFGVSKYQTINVNVKTGPWEQEAWKVVVLSSGDIHSKGKTKRKRHVPS